ncbi:hypothetical protein AVEN_224714-1 [Araneus ventricosus]|uniref:Uncharacterized protein n=1 Tax=Araneus ventricosus TaxID=182803 RepID=A0A4Y2EVW9_ARAVE|nr:hypothetical protein AVEN_224714-1 [Araneus ventricosus]
MATTAISGQTCNFEPWSDDKVQASLKGHSSPYFQSHMPEDIRNITYVRSPYGPPCSCGALTFITILAFTIPIPGCGLSAGPHPFCPPPLIMWWSGCQE